LPLALRRHAVVSAAWFMRCRLRPDLSEFEQFETERFDLRKDAEHRGAIFKQAGEHGLAARRLRHHRGKGGQSGSSEPAPYPNRVQAPRCGHVVIVRYDLVNRRRRNQVIAHSGVTRYLCDVRKRPVERSRSSRAC
jgi:hypothetical protein